MERAPQTQARFFVEEHPENLKGKPRWMALQEILTPETCQFLNDHGWGISLAMIENDKASEEVIGKMVKGINQSFPDIPVSAWIVVPDKDGYWTNSLNVFQTEKKVERVKEWANYHDLDIEAFGFDLEMPIQTFAAIQRKNPRELFREIARIHRIRKSHQSNGYDPEAHMQYLLSQLNRESIITHSYEMPAPLNSRHLGVLQNTYFDTRVTMVYSTNGFPRLIEKYIPTIALPQDTYPAIGVYSSTGNVSGRSLGLFDKSPINPNVMEGDVKTLSEKGRFKQEGFPDQIWIFALDGIKIPQWTEQAIQKATQNS